MAQVKTNGKDDALEIPAALRRGTAKPSYEELVQMVAALQAKAAQANAIKLKVSEKGAVSAYGLGRFPVTLYSGQWERLLDAADEIREFMKANADKLSTK
jgi:hypothetical protein